VLLAPHPGTPSSLLMANSIAWSSNWAVTNKDFDKNPRKRHTKHENAIIELVFYSWVNTCSVQELKISSRPNSRTLPCPKTPLIFDNKVLIFWSKNQTFQQEHFDGDLERCFIKQRPRNANPKWPFNNSRKPHLRFHWNQSNAQSEVIKEMWFGNKKTHIKGRGKNKREQTKEGRQRINAL